MDVLLLPNRVILTKEIAVASQKGQDTFEALLRDTFEGSVQGYFRALLHTHIFTVEYVIVLVLTPVNSTGQSIKLVYLQA